MFFNSVNQRVVFFYEADKDHENEKDRFETVLYVQTL